ncbi:hypothetical protein, partial [Akkermansia sp. BIOML-A55]|uniref:hypothetical protein n=1 Tax=Akkermansia sp. BIOML-A55 TaxID=2584611 RepID=UPI001959224E
MINKNYRLCENTEIQANSLFKFSKTTIYQTYLLTTDIKSDTFIFVQGRNHFYEEDFIAVH